MMDRVPRSVDSAARGVGTHIPKYDETSASNGVVGEQCSGREDDHKNGQYEKVMLRSRLRECSRIDWTTIPRVPVLSFLSTSDNLKAVRGVGAVQYRT